MPSPLDRLSEELDRDILELSAVTVRLWQDKVRAILTEVAAEIERDRDNTGATMDTKNEVIVMLREKVAALAGDRDRLEAQVRRLTVCDCGRELTRGQCGICDNDE